MHIEELFTAFSCLLYTETCQRVAFGDENGFVKLAYSQNY